MARGDLCTLSGLAAQGWRLDSIFRDDGRSTKVARANGRIEALARAGHETLGLETRSLAFVWRR